MKNNAHNMSKLQRAYDNLAPEDDEEQVECEKCGREVYADELTDGLCELCVERWSDQQ